MFHHRSAKKGKAACIFVHAGAGYHSVQNERIHLEACVDAAKSGMAILRAGGTAVDAVEIAIKILEDREITNAGYGSNLALDGIVECDAVVVDHNGRSGAVGAVAQIKNPISLARLVLDHTTQQLSLRRVPPVLLVGQGATDFAGNIGMSILPHDALVSPAAKERWLRWQADLKQAERKNSYRQVDLPASQLVSSETSFDPIRKFTREENARRAHTKGLDSSIWNDAQPISPPPSDDVVSESSSRHSSAPASVNGTYSTEDTSPDKTDYAETKNGVYTDLYGPPRQSTLAVIADRSPQLSTTTSDGHETTAGFSDPEVEMSDYDDADDTQRMKLTEVLSSRSRWHDGSSGSSETESTTTSLKLPSLTPSPPLAATAEDLPTLQEAASVPLPESPNQKKFKLRPRSPLPRSPTPFSDMESPRSSPELTRDSTAAKQDHVTDTVGAIAIDNYGNIACGASSGGIGMKHRGRIGPAALVGVGAAVVPVDPDDKSRTSVATVISGTGEHMATTMASTVFAERLYSGTQKVKGGGFQEADNDDELIKATIEREFMGHPSVRTSNSTGAIGILSVKKTREGVYLYFAHNTDSFAIASQHADDPRPLCTMSRNTGGRAIAQGGRALRHRKRRAV